MRRDTRKLLFSGLVLSGFLLLMAGLLLDITREMHWQGLVLGAIGVALMFISVGLHTYLVHRRARAAGREDD